MDRRQMLATLIVGWVGRVVATPVARDGTLTKDALGTDPAVATNSAVASPAIANKAEWVALLLTIFPHALDRSLYDPSVAALNDAADKDAAVRDLITAGWISLRRAVPVPWSDATPEQRHAAVSSLSTGPFFALLRRTAAFMLYSNPLVWKAFSYDGDAWHFGGWLGRPEFGVLDWLPDPPIGEAHS